jgi:hypothetical protein
VAGAADRIVLDTHGRVLFRCSMCGAPMRERDFAELGLRVPEYGETAEEYCSAELVDELEHRRCSQIRARRSV